VEREDPGEDDGNERPASYKCGGQLADRRAEHVSECQGQSGSLYPNKRREARSQPGIRSDVVLQ